MTDIISVLVGWGCMYVYSCIYIYVHTYMEARHQSRVSFFGYGSTLCFVFQERVLTGLKFPRKARPAPAHPQFYNHHVYLYLTWVLGIQFWGLWLHIKHFIDCTTPQSSLGFSMTQNEGSELNTWRKPTAPWEKGVDKTQFGSYWIQSLPLWFFLSQNSSNWFYLWHGLKIECPSHGLVTNCCPILGCCRWIGGEGRSLSMLFKVSCP